MQQKNKMLRWMHDLWAFPRSITGKGTYDTLKYLKKINNDLNIHSYKTGTKVFDWEIPDEWNIYDAYIEHESKKKYAKFTDSNLHILGYSIPFNKTVTLQELLGHIYTHPEDPDVIPYVTSYYKDRWGFCMSENEKQSLPHGNYRVFIDSKKSPGVMNLADLVINGKKSDEVFISTNVCHPSMANNELSGPVVSSALIQYIKSNYSNPKYTYRFVFVPETIGSITYLSKNLNKLKNNVICGLTLSCVGDNRGFSHINSRLGNNMADIALKAALIGRENVVTYSFLKRGSDERQYCSPGVDLPLCGFSRTKYGEYKEYHTSADDFNVVTSEGLEGSLDVIKSIVDAFETGLFPKTKTKCEPNLGNKGLYSTISQTGSHNPTFSQDGRLRLNLLAYSDGRNSLFDISNIIGKNLKTVITEAKILEKHGVISISDTCFENDD